MPRVAFILVAVIVTAVAIVALRGPRDIAGRPWYASELDSIEFADVDTDWQYDDTVPYSQAKPPLKVARSVEGPESAGVIAPIKPVEPVTPITEPAIDIKPPKANIDSPEVVQFPPIPESPETESPVRPDLTQLPPINEEAEEQPPAPIFDGPELGPPMSDQGDSPSRVTDGSPNETPPTPDPRIEQPVRFPPVPGVGEDEPPLPATDANSIENADPSDFAHPAIDTRDVALHAADAVEFRVPNGWRTLETAFGRELRLVVLPPGAEAKAAMPTDGLWLSYHVRPFSRKPERDEIQQMFDARMKLAAPESVPDSDLIEETINGLPGVSRAFVVQEAEPTDGKLGFHMLIGAEHGIVEIHAVASLDLSQDREVAWREIINSLAISAPQLSDEKPVPQAIDAKRILGSWKSMRSSLQLRPDGTISIIADPKRGALLDGSSPESQPEKVNGRYQAQGDLIMVKWDDGSLLNYRWKRDGIRLLMTDSEGRISQLRRFYQ